MTNGRPQTRYSANLSWSPWPIVQLRGSIDYAEAAPSFDQLDGPIVTTVGRLFDYARQEIAEPVWITGGTPDLRRGSRSEERRVGKGYVRSCRSRRSPAH